MKSSVVGTSIRHCSDVANGLISTSMQHLIEVTSLTYINVFVTFLQHLQEIHDEV